MEIPWYTEIFFSVLSNSQVFCWETVRVSPVRVRMFYLALKATTRNTQFSHTQHSELPHSQSFQILKASRYSKLPDRKTVLKIIINSVLFINSQSNTAPLSSFVLTEDPFSTVDTHRLYWSPTDWITLRVTAIRNGSSVRTNLDNGAVFDWEFINRTLLREKKQRFRRKKTRQNFTSQIFVCTCFCCADMLCECSRRHV